MNYLKILVLLNLILFIYSCGAAREGFTNQKKENKDEFLVEKKSPLMMPPDYDELPLPNSEVGDTQNSENNVKKLIVNNENDNSKSLNQDGSNKKIEESLIEKIKNN
tara:strand:+ start:360 stop:680 length:321 start_codon:yes stop_codon:yes gene_type:complete